MSVSIVEKVLGTANPYSIAHLDDTIRLAKSFTIHHKYEAQTYNDLVTVKYRKVPNKYHKETWRYYKHLAGQYHEVDVPMKVISRDNREEIILSRETLKVHVDTRRSLTHFGAFYDEVVEKYPEQELLLRSFLASNEPMPINEIIELSDWQIVGYNNDLVETQETDLILRLQERINNFSIRNLITNYTLVDNLFMSILFCQLYVFIYLNILAIRFSNLKTSRVHSYHLLNYFASHHGLDTSYPYIDNYQRMFLYRNLKYLNSHSGKEDTFTTLIEKFFDRKRVVITNYEYKQLNEVLEDRSTKYGYKQKLLNKIPFVHSETIYTPEELGDKEIAIHKNNSKEYEYNFKDIDFKMSNSLNSTLKTKDLEITVMDRSNDVKHKLLDILIDYWGVTIELGYNQSLVPILDTITGKELILDSRDAYKLFIVAVHFNLGVEIDVIPDITVWRAFKENIPKDYWLFERLQKPWPLIKEIVNRHSVQAPRYVHLLTRGAFRSYIERVYRYELGAWIYLSSTGDLTSHYDIYRGFEDLHRPYRVHNGNEKVEDFLKRIELEELYEFTKEDCFNLAKNVLNKSSDNVLEATEIDKLTQKAVVEIFSKFKSYTTQFLNIFDKQDTRLLGLVAPYYTNTFTCICYTIPILVPKEVNCETHIEGFRWLMEEDIETKDKHCLCYFDEIPSIDSIKPEVYESVYVNGPDEMPCISLIESESTPDTKLNKELFLRLLKKESE